MERMKGSFTKRPSAKGARWVVVGHNRDGSPFAVIFDDRAKAADYAKRTGGKLKGVST